jgi:hypothetical protein
MEYMVYLVARGIRESTVMVLPDRNQTEAPENKHYRMPHLAYSVTLLAFTISAECYHDKLDFTWLCS